MSYTKITATRYKCVCQAKNKDGSTCGYEWESDTLPLRCARCKRPSWNGIDKRKGQSITFNGESRTISEWAKKLGMKQQTIRYRFKNGWELEDCLFPGAFARGARPKDAK